MAKFLPFSGLNTSEQVLLTHGDSIERLGDKLKVSATSKNTSIVAGVFNEEDKVYGVQFHPEVDLTPNGKQMLSNFLHSVCGLSKSFSISNRKGECIKYIRESVGDKKVLVSWRRRRKF